MARLDWNGPALRRRVALAAAYAVDKTTSECVSGAKRDHPWDNETGFEEGSIMAHPAVFEDAAVRGRWGAYTNYSLYLEIGTSRIGPTAQAREAESPEGMWTIPEPQPEPGVTVRQEFTILPPGTMEGQDDFVTLHQPSYGTGPLMAPRPFLRPQADLQNPRLAERMRAALAGGEMP